MAAASSDSHDYHAHISRIMKTPSLIHGAPHYPNVHKAFNNNANNNANANANNNSHEEDQEQQQHQSKPKPKPKKRVQLMDPQQATVNRNNGIVETHVDSEAEGFIQQKRKGFKLCKWKTFWQ